MSALEVSLLILTWYAIGFAACAWSFKFEMDRELWVLCFFFGFFGPTTIWKSIELRIDLNEFEKEIDEIRNEYYGGEK